ncbi:MAG: LAGLIDADG family homing endonuclease [Candidatus Nanohaloarchaea archaeon]
MEYGEAVTEFEEFFSEEYYEEVAEAVQEGEESIVVDFMEMDVFNPELSDFLREDPDSALDAAEEGVKGVDIISDEELRVRFFNMPEEEFVLIKNLRSKHLGKFVPIKGMIKRASQVKPEVVSAIFECSQCGDRYEKEQDSSELKSPYKCDCGSRKFEVQEKKMTDTQNIVVEEDPESREGSEQPSTLGIRLRGDLVDPDFQKKVVPGNKAEITGVLRETPLQKNSKKFDIYMEGNYLDPTEQEFEELELDEEEIEEIKELAEDPEIFDKIARSIAPSIYGHHQIKKAIALQLFGGVRKTREDGVESRGDIHILLIGEPGTGKCVAPGTNVYKNGERKNIEDIVESGLNDSDQIEEIDDGVYAEVDLESIGINSAGEIENKKVSKVWKRDAPEEMIRITTNSGRNIEVTPSHPLFIQRHGSIEPVKAEKLKEDEFIAANRSLEINGEDPIKVDYRKSKARNSVRLNPPEKIDPGFARLLGYTAAEGYIQQRESNSNALYITNNDEEILGDIEQQLERLGVNHERRYPHEGKEAEEIICCSSELTSFLTELNPSLDKPSSERKMSDKIFSSSKKCVKGFLKAFIDAEGTVSRKEREISVGSTSREILEQIQDSLLRFEVQSQLRPREESFRLRMSGKDFERYIEEIGLVTERKIESASKFDSDMNTNTDVVPHVGEPFRRIRKTLGMTQFDFSIDRGSYQHYERMDRNPSRSNFDRVVADFEERLETMAGMLETLENPDWETIKQVRKELGFSQNQISENISGSQTLLSSYENQEIKKENKELKSETIGYLTREILERISRAGEKIRQMRELAENDIRWDKIEKIERIQPDYDNIYDLEIPEQHNYITNGLISHNSQMLQFTGELAPKGRYVVGKSSTGAGLCVTGDTLIHTEKGFREIGEIGRKEIPFETKRETAKDCRMELPSFNEGELDKSVSNLVWRMPEKDCHRIETVYGKEIEASDNTEILSCDESGLEWKKISEIEEGDFIAAPDYSEIERQKPDALGYYSFDREKFKLKPESAEKIRERMRKEYGDLRTAASEMELSEDFVYTSIKQRFVPNKRLRHILNELDLEFSELEIDEIMLQNGESFSLPEKFDGDMMYLIGLVFGDGNISVEDKRGLVRISNSETELLERVREIIREKFDKQVEIEEHEERVPYIRIHSKTIAKFFENIGMRSPKEGLELNSRLTLEEDADYFLRGLFDADGSVVSRNNSSDSIQLSTISHKLADQVQLMLETYGIQSRKRTRDRRGVEKLENGQEIESKSVQKHLVIRGENIDKFAEKIGFGSEKKENALKRITGKDRNSNIDVVPVNQILQKSEASGGNHWSYFNQQKNPGEERFQKILSETLIEDDLDQAAREISESEVNWEEVKKIEETGKKELFDLTVPETNNFFGNGIITHNTAAVVRNEQTGEFELEAGAVVLANKGMAAIDEIDKMSSEDRSSLHEAMEQQCFGPELKVTRPDGTIEEISNIVDPWIEKEDSKVQRDGKEILELDEGDEKIFTFSGGEVEQKSVSVVGRRPAPEKMLEIELENGRRINVTEEHPFYQYKDGEITETEAEDLNLGEYIIAPREIPVEGEEQELNDIEHEEARKEVEIPEHNSPALAKFTGYQVSDGGYELNRGEKVGFNFTNSNEELLKDYEECIDELFGVEPYVRDRDTRKEMRVVSTELKNWLEELGPILEKREEKKIPGRLLKCRKEELKHLLRAFFDGDGGVYRIQRGYRIRAVVENRELIEQVQDILMRFGIHSKILEDGNVWRLEITRYPDIEKFREHVGFLSEEKQRRLEEATERERDSKEVVPNISEKLMDLVQQSGLKQKEIFDTNLKSIYTDVSRKRVLHVLRLVRERLKNIDGVDYSQEIEDLRKVREKFKISGKEIAERIGVSPSLIHQWEKKGTERRKEYVKALQSILEEKEQLLLEVERIEQTVKGTRFIRITGVEMKEPDFEYVYDLTVPGTNNFIAENMIAHNSISISKANIQATLHAQTSILAAGNPKLGRFDPYEPIPQQIDIGDTLLSRFDFIFPVKDEPDEEKDEKLSSQVLKNHIEPEDTDAEIPQGMLRRYVAYAKKNLRPDLTQDAADKIQEFYVNMRAKGGGEAGDSVPITARQLEALVRVAEASARAELKEEVTEKDADRAIDILTYSLKQVGVDPETGEFDIDVVESGVTSSQRNRAQTIKHILKQMAGDESVQMEDVLDEAESEGLDREKAEKMIKQLMRDGEVFEPEPGKVKMM